MQLDQLTTWAEIDLDAIAANASAFTRLVGPRVQVMAVVKANAYGHGAVQVARAALAAGATRLAVHRAGEGMALRQAGISAPILLMGDTPPAAAELVARWKLTPAVISLPLAQALSARRQPGGDPTPVHIKVDTGMNRYGVQPQDALPLAQALEKLPGVRLEGLFTHFATADAPDQAYLRVQLARFKQVLFDFQRAGIDIPLVHSANSAAAMIDSDTHFDAIRPGIALYGLDPSDAWPPVFPIRPALALKSRVTRVQRLPAGVPVSYGGSYTTPREMLSALVPVGYGDGYPRLLSNRAAVLINGQRAPIIGRVCMDQFVVDASAAPGARVGDEVVLIGRQGDESIRAEELARLAETINYEITTALLPRVARVYTQGGQVIEVAA